MAETERPEDMRPKGPSVRAVPEGDNRERLMCPDCGFVLYDNPKIVVGAVALWQERVLLCKRAINPRLGYWTLPAGYLELNETTSEGALREAREEARARLALDGLLAVYNIPRLSQVQLIYRARLLSPEVAAGHETEAVGLFAWDEIPWSELAFPSVHWALHHAREVWGSELTQVRSNPPGELGSLR
ncbi:MAG TPA: NUDIX hydrolase [Alphaproteobacteria bacterium]|nr:NUDIX hydrolase [Alphaproteobacteria bacterium]